MPEARAAERTTLDMSPGRTREGDLVWAPPADVLSSSRVGQFMQWVCTNRDVDLATHSDLWSWSVDDLEGFWGAIWEYFNVTASVPYTQVLATREMPGATWFLGARLNYAENALADRDANRVAVLGRSQTREDVDLTFAQLAAQVARAQHVLRDLGVGPGDRVAAYLPNVPEALVAYLATASLGAVWASCASEFGPSSVVDRLSQIEPVVLIVAGGYRYGAKDIDRREQIATIRAQLPSVRHVLDIEYGNWRAADAVSWPQALAQAAGDKPRFAQVPFDHPLVVLFSSGTTGKPKAIVHGHGGILIEHLKNHALSWDMGETDRLLWFTTTSWMMWNSLASALLVGSSLVMIDGNPLHPDLEWQWRLASETKATVMGASPGFLMTCRRDQVDLRNGPALCLRILCSAGAPLPPEGYAWVSEQLGPSVQLNVGSGGTDVCSGLVQNNPLLPVWAGKISGRCLGVDAHAFDDAGEAVVGQLGELVITSPMQSMPFGFWDDLNGQRLAETYFDRYPGVWRHGDWIEFDSAGACRVAGRSDATLNRGGVRLGTAEFYQVVEEMTGVSDSLVVHLEDDQGGAGELVLFVQPAAGVKVDETLRQTIRVTLRDALSPRHVPDTVLELRSIPRNRTGKKLEVPVKRILQGASPHDVASRDTLVDVSSLDAMVEVRLERAKLEDQL
jgi:acetoacetyl-CoA synthetase